MKFNTILFACFMISSAVFSQTKPEVLTNKGVIELSKAGFGKDMILAKIESSNCKFDVSTAALIDLKKQGVPDDVVKAIMDRSNSTSTSGGTAPAPNTSGSSSSSSNGSKKAIVSSKTANNLAAGVDLMNHVYSYNKSTQAVAPLEKSVAGIRTKQGPFGGSVMLHVDGAKAATRIASQETLSFVINTGSSALPELMLYKLKSGKDKREVASMKLNSFTGMKTGEDVISLNVSKLEDGIFLITPVKSLAKGEYFFSGKPVAGATSADAYSFGVE
jgi:hypothetical protein